MGCCGTCKGEGSGKDAVSEAKDLMARAATELDAAAILLDAAAEKLANSDIDFYSGNADAYEEIVSDLAKRVRFASGAAS